jgi:hypothetical protein
MDSSARARRRLTGIVEWIAFTIECPAGRVTRDTAGVAFTREVVDKSSLSSSSVKPAEAPRTVFREVEHTVTLIGVVTVGEGLVDCTAVDLAAHELITNSGGPELLAAAQLIDELERERAIVDEAD